MASTAALKTRLLNDPKAAREANPHLDEEDTLDEIVLVAVNDGDAYRDAKNAKRAVEAAMTDYRRRMDTEIRETFALIRQKAIEEVARQWRG